jgi:hypothetical protein
VTTETGALAAGFGPITVRLGRVSTVTSIAVWPLRKVKPDCGGSSATRNVKIAVAPGESEKPAAR